MFDIRRIVGESHDDRPEHRSASGACARASAGRLSVAGRSWSEWPVRRAGCRTIGHSAFFPDLSSAAAFSYRTHYPTSIESSAHLCGELRDHERAARLPHGELLRPRRERSLRYGRVQTRRADHKGSRRSQKEVRMKRFHVNVSVADIPEAIRFYTALFAAPPNLVKDDYAKWMLENPRVNFAISKRGYPIGVNHLGFQVESAAELTGMQAQLLAADHSLIEQADAACCYARSDKYWITDPAGLAWETFHTLQSIPLYGADTDMAPKTAACCVPEKAESATNAKAAAACCA